MDIEKMRIRMGEMAAEIERLNADRDQLLAQEPDKQGYFAYDYDTGFELFDTAEDAEAAAQKHLDGYREWAHEGWDEGVEQVCWGRLNGSITSEQCGLVPFEGEMVEGVNYKLFRHAQAVPAQQVKMPTNVDEAAAMQMIGMAWLEQNAPERLQSPQTGRCLMF